MAPIITAVYAIPANPKFLVPRETHQTGRVESIVPGSVYEASRKYRHVEFGAGGGGEHPMEKKRREMDELVSQCWDIQKALYLDPDFAREHEDELTAFKLQYFVDCLKKSQLLTDIPPTLTPDQAKIVSLELNHLFQECKNEGKLSPELCRKKYTYGEYSPDSKLFAQLGQASWSPKRAPLRAPPGGTGKNALAQINMAIGSVIRSVTKPELGGGFRGPGALSMPQFSMPPL
ncbi:MAG: hypothetical protein M1816_004372 [Peltula sp. TS41687]|nr:MAG: hypothetical protein M1816_004372 [Peltula sp. TS41687]